MNRLRPLLRVLHHMFPQLRLTPARAAFARPGPHATAFPDVNALMQPSDSLVPVGRRSGRLSPTAYAGAEVLFFTAAPVPPLTGATPKTILPRLPASRLSPEEKRGDPKCLGHPLRACRGQRPRRVRTAPRPSRGAAAVAFRRANTLGTRKQISLVAAWPTAHSLACLRFAEVRYRLRRKARYRPGGLTLRRASFAPAG